jgi:hypothetical protein
MVPCVAGNGACYHDLGVPSPIDSVGGGATAFASLTQTQWSADRSGALVSRPVHSNVSFTGLPYPSHATHFTGNGLRFGGTAGVVLPSPTTYLQTAIVNWDTQLQVRRDRGSLMISASFT